MTALWTARPASLVGFVRPIGDFVDQFSQVIRMPATPATPRAAAGPAPGLLPAGLDAAPAEELVGWALDRFGGGRAAVITALQAEGMVVVDMALRADPGARVITIDTGRLPEATLAFVDVVRAHYRRDIEVVRPDPADVVALVSAHGADPFYISPELRLRCCRVRKVEPLDVVLGGLDCWMSGLRRGQSPGRAATPVAQPDPRRPRVLKLNPLATWTEAEVAAYSDEHGVPRHPLYRRGYRSIGCAPCTRALGPGEPERAGRWWWERGIDTECGIHGLSATSPAEG